MENRILEELEQLKKAIREKQGETSNLKKQLMMSFCNVISSIVLGKRYNYDDKQYHEILNNVDTTTKLFNYVGIVGVFPFLCKLPGDLFGAKKLMNSEAKTYKIIQQLAANHRSGKEILKESYITEYIRMQRERSGDHESPFTGILYNYQILFRVI